MAPIFAMAGGKLLPQIPALLESTPRLHHKNHLDVDWHHPCRYKCNG
jgi:hypothetical protein